MFTFRIQKYTIVNSNNIKGGRLMPENKKLSISSKKYKGETSVISARIPDQMIADIDKICDKTGRNRNEIISLCLEFAINNIEIDKETQL